MTDNERWLPVPGYEGRYEVSDAGRVRSLPRERQTERQMLRWPGRMLKAFIDPSTGYLCVNLGDGKRSKKLSVHVLVLEAFVGPRPAGKFGLHGNNDRSDPRLTNLRWGTPGENSDDMVRHGTRLYGEQVANAVLTDELVAWIKESGQSSLKLAPIIGVASSTIRAVRTGQNWARRPAL